MTTGHLSACSLNAQFRLTFVRKPPKLIWVCRKAASQDVDERSPQQRAQHAAGVTAAKCVLKCTLSGLKLVMVSHCLHLGSVCHSVTTMYPDIRHGVTVPARQQRVQSKLVQQAHMELALREGLRLVVDCSFIAACSAREVRAVELPQDSAAACPQICHQPRTLLQPKV